MAVRIGTNLAATIAWCAEMATPTTGPIATTTDGTADAIVWYTSDGQLRGVDGDTGATIYSSDEHLRGRREVDLADRGQGADRRGRQRPSLRVGHPGRAHPEQRADEGAEGRQAQARERGTTAPVGNCSPWFHAQELFPVEARSSPAG